MTIKLIKKCKLPIECPECGNDIRSFMNHPIKPCRLGRIIQTIAWALLPVMFVTVVYSMFFVTTPSGPGVGAGWFVAGMIAGPSFALYCISTMLPRVWCVKCYRCQWHKDIWVRRTSTRHRKKAVQ